MHFFVMGISFINGYINSTIKTKYLDDGGSGVKPKRNSSKKTGIICSFGYSSRGQIWDRYIKIKKWNCVRKKSAGYIYLPEK